MFLKLKNYIKESYAEFSRVNWPTRQETIRLTGVVIALSLMIAFFLGAADFSFSFLLERFFIR